MLRRLLHDRLAMVGVAILVVMLVAAFVVPHLYPYDYQQIDPVELLHPPSPRHWFGTNAIGQDVFAQTMRGLQKSLVIAFLVALLSTTLAAVVGATGGYLLGLTDRVLTWVTQVLLVVPSFVIIAICSPWFKGRNYLILVLLLGAFGWMVTSRMVRAVTLSLRQREFVRAAQFMGASRRSVITRHILPSMASILVVDVTLNVGAAIVGESTLSFFGFGVQPPDISLGTLIAAGTSSALTYPWLFLYCCGSLVLIVLATNLVGDGLRDALDPGSRSRQS
ncbi:ABC transporter permease [Tsukamurella soli]|uniref:ABC transporter permease n=1 Tax=Tsukamurella soli TaxID=644556 RepID=UPI00360DFBB9